MVDWGAMDYSVPYRDADPPKREPMPSIMLPKKYPDDCLGAAHLDLCEVGILLRYALILGTPTDVTPAICNIYADVASVGVAI